MYIVKITIIRYMISALIVVSYLIAPVCYAQDVKSENGVSIGTVEDGVSIFDMNNQGQRAWEVHGKSAKFIEDGFVEIDEVQAIFYENKDQSSQVVITSPSAQINQATKQVRTDQSVTITTQDMIITGDQMEGNMRDKQVQLKRNVRVVITGDQKDFFF